MLLKSLISKIPAKTSPGHIAAVQLPVKLGMSDAEEVFSRPLDRRLRAIGLGHVAGTTLQRDGQGGIDGIEISLILATLHPRALDTVGSVLEDLDAPLGSSVGFSETRARHIFGRTEGLGLYLDGQDSRGNVEAHLDVLEACTEALEGAGVYQGGSKQGDRHVLYFYGDSYNAMKNALSFVLSTNPLCRGAYARRLS